MTLPLFKVNEENMLDAALNHPDLNIRREAVLARAAKLVGFDRTSQDEHDFQMIADLYPDDEEVPIKIYGERSRESLARGHLIDYAHRFAGRVES